MQGPGSNVVHSVPQTSTKRPTGVWKIEPLVGRSPGGATRWVDMRSRLVLLISLLAVLLVALAGATSASAADTHAPNGARLDWLPADEWVMSAWMPFDEARLDAVLKTGHDELVTWLDDRRTLLRLARAHGVKGSAAALAHTLVAPRLARVPRALRPVLESRARTMLTQAHLSRHVLLHVFHTPAIPRAARGIFGVSPARFRALRDSALTPIAIGAKGGRSAAHVRGALWSLLVARAGRGVRAGAISRAEADHLLGEQRRQLTLYLGRAFRTPEQQIAFLCRPRYAAAVKSASSGGQSFSSAATGRPTTLR
jgi:hypothetical protein